MVRIQCVVGGCEFVCDHKEEDKMIQHFKDKHPEIHSLRLGNKVHKLK